MVRFILAAGAVPEGFEPDSFFARYMAPEGVYVPKWLKPDGTIAPVPFAGFLTPDSLLIFEDVPEVGKLVPGIHSSQPGVAFAIREHNFTLEKPAINKAKYIINFTRKVEIQGEVDQGIPGHTCPECKGLGVIHES